MTDAELEVEKGEGEGGNPLYFWRARSTDTVCEGQCSVSLR